MRPQACSLQSTQPATLIQSAKPYLQPEFSTHSAALRSAFLHALLFTALLFTALSSRIPCAGRRRGLRLATRFGAPRRWNRRANDAPSTTRAWRLRSGRKPLRLALGRIHGGECCPLSSSFYSLASLSLSFLSRSRPHRSHSSSASLRLTRPDPSSPSWRRSSPSTRSCTAQRLSTGSARAYASTMPG